MNLHDLKYKIQDNIKYIGIGFLIIFLLLLTYIVGGKFIDLKEKQSPMNGKNHNNVNVVDIENKKNNKEEIKGKTNLEEKKANEKEVEEALGKMIGKGENTKKEIVKEDVDLQNIKNIDLYLKQKEEIKNNITLPKKILEKFYQKMKGKYVFFLKDNIVKSSGGIKKHFIKNEKKILKENYPDFDLNNPILITGSKLNYLYEDITNYKTISKNKCSKVFGKKVCQKEVNKYIAYNGKYINIKALDKIKFDNKNYVYLILKKKNLKEYTLILPFHKKYGIYGYNFLLRYKQALKYRDYSFLYFISKNNIKTLKDVYIKDILNTYNKIFLGK